MEHLITLKNWSPAKIRAVLDLAKDVKAHPKKYNQAMAQKTLLMIFEKPSLRTRLSFEAGMTQMGGHAIYYHTGNSPMGSGKETISDSIKTASRFVDIIMARLFKHSDLLEMAEFATVPVINALTDDSHPCQILADLQAIEEKKGTLSGLKLAYLGDGFNNVTHSLMFGGVKMGMHVAVGSPAGADFSPRADVVEDCKTFAASLGRIGFGYGRSGGGHSRCRCGLHRFLDELPYSKRSRSRAGEKIHAVSGECRAYAPRQTRRDFYELSSCCAGVRTNR